MFFALLCLLLWALFALRTPFDVFGWLMVVALAWFCGFMDGRRTQKSDASLDSTMPPEDPDHPEDTGKDATLFQS